ncbi:MAG TPA: thioredoxin family protein [Acidobacteriaceae bacterium]|nr:thioredoxin family protein [Acidobacteriaceae bacterium]
MSTAGTTQAMVNDGNSLHRVVSHGEWLKERLALLEKEKACTRLRDQLNAERLALPWVRVEKEYIFDSPQGKISLSDLFDGRNQLFIKHFMMGPGQQGQCVGCSLEVDHVEGILLHLESHDVSYVSVARAPIDEIEAVRQKMGWKFRWVSSFNNTFSYDFGGSFRPEEMAVGSATYNYRQIKPVIADLSGNSAFFKDPDGQIYHTYSSFGRGPEPVLGIYGILDMMPKGRNETGPYRTLADWARLHNMYGKGGTVEVTGRYHEPKQEHKCGCTH